MRKTLLTDKEVKNRAQALKNRLASINKKFFARIAEKNRKYLAGLPIVEN